MKALKKQLSDDEILDGIYQYGGCLPAAKELGITEWNARRTLARAGGEAHKNFLALKAVEAAAMALDEAVAALKTVPAGYRWKVAVALGQLASSVLHGRSASKTAAQLQQIQIHLGPDEARSLKETAETLDAEAIDVSDA